ncbi:hypothetical protein NVP1189B_42 [Vibrio phage 1.189.B._10N.286.51.B5]|nr:hypothetical protein NVP1189B_42 [Vibrio phage 1.189.B._10N.286.51.B5]AUR93934.1 hypothetical protein NVP1189C_42 [Vibrio phage 1.189.C._10N.286.51.B5]AUR94000.1 hypothetical protein NVP1189O_42 [Vibrio phage 1.189.O._10N.286.51.B5]
MMKLTAPINKTALPHIIAGMERHGDDYRFRYHGNWYKVVAAKPGMRGYVNLILESVL